VGRFGAGAGEGTSAGAGAGTGSTLIRHPQGSRGGEAGGKALVLAMTIMIRRILSLIPIYTP
jgi:hypothetical protein